MSKIQEIIKRCLSYDDEQEWFDYKENWFEPDEIGQYISALSNAAAMAGELFGYLIWGVHDKTHELTDTTVNYQRDVKNEPIEHYLARNVSPAVYFTFDENIIDGKRVVVLSIPAARIVPTAYKGIRYIRVGSSKENIQKYPEREAALFRVLNFGLPSLLNTPARFGDLTFEQLFLYFEMKGIRLRKNTFKKNLELLTADGEYNLLAQLLSDDPRIPIRFALFTGTDKTSTMYAVREFGNMCLLLALDKVLDYGDTLNVPQADERNRKVERKEVMLFDVQAFREAVINAFQHNLWVGGASPMFTAFQDRIEITSIGTMPPKQTKEGFFAGVSVPVNEKLTEIFVQLHISEKSGRGVPRITGAYGEDAFHFSDNAITVTIPYERLDLGDNDQVEGVNPLVDEPIPLDNEANPLDSEIIPPDEKENGRVRNDNAQVVQDRILDFCIEAKGISEILNELGYRDKKTVRKYLDPLVEQGRIAMTIPDKPTSRNQKYITIR